MRTHARKTATGKSESRGTTSRPPEIGSALGLASTRTLDVVHEIQHGLPFESFEQFQAHTGMPLGQLSAWIGVRDRTLARRKREGRLQPNESDRLLRAARLYASVLMMCSGDGALAATWLGAPQRGLGGERPLDLAATEVGTAAVEALVGRVEHGIPG
ncbi:MAG: antitoxin Xre-like helix-turn-helix domain-containing protein [Candidatus Eisenbacteria bacterium]